MLAENSRLGNEVKTYFEKLNELDGAGTSNLDQITDSDGAILKKFISFSNRVMAMPQSSKSKTGAVKRKFKQLEAYEENTRQLGRTCKYASFIWYISYSICIQQQYFHVKHCLKTLLNY